MNDKITSRPTNISKTFNECGTAGGDNKRWSDNLNG